MGLWVLEPKTTEPVPGTVHIRREHEKRLQDTVVLKHGTGRHANLVLVPQPSDSPNDPLNWSKWSRHLHLLYLSAGTGLMGGTHNFVNPANKLMAKYFHTSITTISRSVSIILLMFAVSAFITSPLARIYGKRPVFLVSNAIATLGYIIVIAKPSSLVCLYVGRAIHGLGISALEYLVSSSVGDLMFVHERGVHLAIWHFALSGGNSVGQVIGSQIVAAQGWIWPFRYTVIILVVYTIILYLACPETTYNRAAKFNTDHVEITSDSSSEKTAESDPPSKSYDAVAVQEEPVESRSLESIEGTAEKKHTYWQSLKVYNGRFTDESLLRSLITPWSAFLLPAVSWTAYTYGCSVAFSASFSVSISQIFSKPPYRFDTSQTGLTVLSAFIGAFLGNAIPGPLSDWLVKYMSRKNNGVYEPEFRNVLCVPGLIFGLMGFWGFGWSLEAKAHWMAPVFFFGLATFSTSIQSFVSNAYLLDCHRMYAQDGYAAVTIFRGVFSFVMTFVINDWIARDGNKTVFFVIGMLHGVNCVLGMVLYVYGKKVRYWVSKNRFIQNSLAKVKGARATV